MSNEALTSISLTISFFSFVVAGLSFFKEKIFEFFKPGLEVEVNCNLPDCGKTPFFTSDGTKRWDGYQYRIKIDNKNKQEAKGVRVSAEKLEKYNEGKYTIDNNFISLFFIWTHHLIVELNIYGETSAFCDFGKIHKPESRQEVFKDNADKKTIFDLDTSVKPFTKSNLLHPGKYRLTIKVSGANIKPTIKVIEINNSGNWYNDEKKMLNEGTRIALYE